ncbi:MAG: hypothetical protein HY709_08150 [Candidatus Latescibacteria bacterium]|nr:hypothetical protein [Candidatus Latescibacterota bacterium]
MATRWGGRGCKDDEILPFLFTLRQPTLFTGDRHFYRRSLRHARYGLVYLDVGQWEAALFVRRLLRHREVDTHAKRMGAVIRASHTGLAVWRLHAEREVHVAWTD